jgi:hypothetical protein
LKKKLKKKDEKFCGLKNNAYLCRRFALKNGLILRKTPL